MKDHVRLSATMASVLLLAGCSTTGWMSPAHPFDYIYGTSKEDIKASLPTAAELRDDEASYYKSADENERRRLREKIIGQLRPFIDEFWRRYHSQLFGDTATIKTGFEAATTTFSGAAAITTPSTAAAILSALAAASTAYGSSMEKNFFNQQSLPVVLHQMEADVSLYGQKIEAGLAKSTTEYPLSTALADLSAYSRAMSIPSALASLNAAAGAQKQAVKEKIMGDLGIAPPDSHLGPVVPKTPPPPGQAPASPSPAPTVPATPAPVTPAASQPTSAPPAAAVSPSPERAPGQGGK